MFILVFSHTVTLKFSRHKCPNHSDKLSLRCLIQNHFHLNPYEDATGNYREYSQQAIGHHVSCILHALLRQHLAGLLEKFLQAQHPSALQTQQHPRKKRPHQNTLTHAKERIVHHAMQ